MSNTKLDKILNEFVSGIMHSISKFPVKNVVPSIYIVTHHAADTNQINSYSFLLVPNGEIKKKVVITDPDSLKKVVQERFTDIKASIGATNEVLDVLCMSCVVVSETIGAHLICIAINPETKESLVDIGTIAFTDTSVGLGISLTSELKRLIGSIDNVLPFFSFLPIYIALDTIKDCFTNNIITFGDTECKQP